MKSIIHDCLGALSQIILGKEEQLTLALACLLARGHLLIEDLPGMGKTTLAHALAKVMGLSYRRIQFISDLLPADIIGATVYEQALASKGGCFTFHPGPIFSQVLLADEINRATPKAQSALLEAMEERQVSVDGETYPLPNPFFVIATQNPFSQAGTFPLPESQLDRFLMRIQLGYPDNEAEKKLLLGVNRSDLLGTLPQVLSESALEKIQTEVLTVSVSDSVVDYLLRLVHYTRYEADLAYGLSPRGALAWLTAAKSWAYIQDRTYLLPEDLQTVAPAVVDHRLETTTQGKSQGCSDVIVRSVPVFAHP